MTGEQARAMTVKKLTFASGKYDRFDALNDGRASVPGYQLEHIELWPPRLIFDRMAGAQEFDIAELSCSEYICLMDQSLKSGDACPFIALPVFPSRVFRHGFICVHRDGGITDAKQLEGKRIGVPLFTQTAAIWIRGLLAEEYGVDLKTIHWVEGSVTRPGPHGDPSAAEMFRPAEIEINETGRPLADLLAAGEIDAILGTFVDEAVRDHESIVRLFPNFREVERDYVRRTGIFPIMHLVVMRRDVSEQNPGLGAALVTCFETAKQIANDELRKSNAQRYSLPWLLDDIEELGDIFAGDAWPYGIEPNRKTLETLIGYMHAQGFISRVIPLEELFPET
jgi:4,5-dihydroxyphthalate decarboxylase